MTQAIRTILAGEALTPDQHLSHYTITIADGKVTGVYPTRDEISPASPGVLDARDAVVIPGLVDLQVNGALGWSFQASDRDHFNEILAYHLGAGTTTLLPTLVTADESVLLESLRTLATFIDTPTQVTLPGIHLEGPFLSPEKSGAHDQKMLRAPDLALAQNFFEAAQGHLAMVTLAPELQGAVEIITYFAAQRVVVSAGHSAATYADTRSAVAAGLSFITHAGNASDWPHRAMGEFGFMTSEPGLVGALMAERSLGGSVILDGYHFHPTLMQPLLHLKGVDRLLLVSDASTVAGCPPGDYESGGLRVTVHPKGFATSGRGGGWLAGSTITLLDAVRNAVNLSNISLRDAVTMASRGPAQWLSIGGRKGRLRTGADADILVLNRDLSLRHIIVGGHLI
jgi:N-acetylglucosamine-6-phosphate deacetylase